MTIDRAIEILVTCGRDEYFTTEEVEQAFDRAVNALIYTKIMQTVPTCNNCSAYKSCEYRPAWGAQVRYNCPHHVPLRKGDENHATD